MSDEEDAFRVHLVEQLAAVNHTLKAILELLQDRGYTNEDGLSRFIVHATLDEPIDVNV